MIVNKIKKLRLRMYAAVFILLMTAAAAAPALAQVSVNGVSHENLAAAFAEIASAAGDYDVVVGSDQTVATFTLAAGTNIRISGSANVRLSANGSMFVIEDGASLTLADSVALVGVSANNAPTVFVSGGGTFNMEGGALTGNRISAPGLTGAYRGGAVGVDGGGVFNMSGGVISGNEIYGTGGAVGGAGGVFVYTRATFNFSGGEISGNINSVVSGAMGNGAGGVYVSDGVFDMSGGAVRGNRQTGDLARAGGGVYLAYASAFHLSGGVIEDNAANPASSVGSGDGIFIIGTSSIYLSGDPQVNDGLYCGGNFTTSIRIEDSMNEDARVVVLGSGGSADAMSAATNITAAFSPDFGMTGEAARSFISKDNTLIGKLGGTLANPRVVWAYNYEIALEHAGRVVSGGCRDNNNDNDVGDDGCDDDKTVVINNAVYGYTASNGAAITIRNLAMPSGELVVSLMGDGAENFVLSRENIPSLDKVGGGGGVRLRCSRSRP